MQVQFISTFLNVVILAYGFVPFDESLTFLITGLIQIFSHDSIMDTAYIYVGFTIP